MVESTARLVSVQMHQLHGSVQREFVCTRFITICTESDGVLLVIGRAS